MITREISDRIQAALDPADWDALVSEMSTLRREARTAKDRVLSEQDRAAAIRRKGAEDAHLAQIGRTVALRFTNPTLSLSEEREARQTLITAHLEGA